MAVVTGVAALASVDAPATPLPVRLVADGDGAPIPAPSDSPAPQPSAAPGAPAPAGPAAPNQERPTEHRASAARHARPHHARPRPGSTCTDATWRAVLYAPERWIDAHESRLNPHSVNWSSGARGLGQLLPSTYRHVGVRADWDPCHQIVAQRRYMFRRYHSWAHAKAFWRRHHWW